jgi:hypothetical protein
MKAFLEEPSFGIFFQPGPNMYEGRNWVQH